MLGLHLGQVGLHGGDVLLVDCVFYFRKSAAEHGSADRFHAGVHGRGPVLFNFGDHGDFVWQQDFGDVLDEILADAERCSSR